MVIGRGFSYLLDARIENIFCTRKKDIWIITGDIWLITGGIRKVTGCSSTFYGMLQLILRCEQ